MLLVCFVVLATLFVYLLLLCSRLRCTCIQVCCSLQMACIKFDIYFLETTDRISDQIIINNNIEHLKHIKKCFYAYPSPKLCAKSNMRTFTSNTTSFLETSGSLGDVKTLLVHISFAQIALEKQTCIKFDIYFLETTDRISDQIIINNNIEHLKHIKKCFYAYPSPKLCAKSNMRTFTSNTTSFLETSGSLGDVKTLLVHISFAQIALEKQTCTESLILRVDVNFKPCFCTTGTNYFKCST